MKKVIYLLLNLVVIFLLFMFGNGMTPRPGSSSGNGNPAILLFVPLGILFIVLVVQWFNLIKKRAHIKVTIITLLVLVCHFIAGFYYQVASYRKYRDYLAEVHAEQFGSVDWEYINSITSGLSIHINNQYFNWNTCFLFVSFSMFIALMINVIKLRTEKQL
ncbi:hypothetical protein [Paenibacillus camelliae]|uniref:hypothetical protein n=1 Tax=Paenibacillus camelliae TaxID=512410 RepID=UPI00203D32BC|nr:hypothetical protein [Paenibacillus camelliae]MCM3633644.1 hypothetical protein [Paenibacillus camelliae]